MKIFSLLSVPRWLAIIVLTCFYSIVASASETNTSSVEKVKTFFLDLPEQVANQLHRHSFHYEARLGVGDGDLQSFTWEVETPTFTSSTHKGNLDPEDTGSFVPVKLALQVQSQGGDQDLVLKFAQAAFYRSVGQFYDPAGFLFQRQLQVLEGTYQNNDNLDLSVRNGYRINGLSGRFRTEIGSDIADRKRTSEPRWSFYNDVYWGYGVQRLAHSQDWQEGMEGRFCFGAIRRQGRGIIDAQGCLGRQDIGDDYVDVDSLEIAYQKRGQRLKFSGRVEVQSLNGEDSTSHGVLAVEVMAPYRPSDVSQGLLDFRSPGSRYTEPY